MSDRVQVIWGDSRSVIADMESDSVDAAVGDPPYALASIVARFGADGAKMAAGDVYKRASAGFMGQTWDTGEVAHDPAFWAQVLRVLKPGGYLVMTSGTRTYHRLACAIEDAGFELSAGAEVRDMIVNLVASDTPAGRFIGSLDEGQMDSLLRALDDAEPLGMLAWLYGSGFPKSHDAAKGVDRAQGLAGLSLPMGAPVKRLKPSADQHRDGTWEKSDDRDYQPGQYLPASVEGERWLGWGTALKPAIEPIVLARKPMVGTLAENLAAHGVGALNIDGCRVEAEPDRYAPGDHGIVGQTRDSGYRLTAGRVNDLGRWPANVTHDGSPEVLAAFPDTPGQKAAVSGEERSHITKNAYGNFGSSREGMTPRGGEGSAARFFYSAKADAADRMGSKHPTVKPVDLMAWLVRLVTPPGGLVLDPFAGSGSTGMACLREGRRAVLIERERKYVQDIERRIAHVGGADAPLFSGVPEE